mgnify:CR=1 FL=1
MCSTARRGTYHSIVGLGLDGDLVLVLEGLGQQVWRGVEGGGPSAPCPSVHTVQRSRCTSTDSRARTLGALEEISVLRHDCAWAGRRQVVVVGRQREQRQSTMSQFKLGTSTSGAR